MPAAYEIYPLGDAALVLSFGNRVDRLLNEQVHAVFAHFKANPFTGLLDVVPAYSSISFIFDLYFIKKQVAANWVVFDWVKAQIDSAMPHIKMTEKTDEQLVKIPVCYDRILGNDLDEIAKATGIGVEEVVHLHKETIYQVYMIGFLPGFAYLGQVNEKLELPRKAKPADVKAGCVAIAGKQTGIYPLDSYGGWHIVGYTPIRMFDKWAEPDENGYRPTFVQPGQLVSFYPIDKEAYWQIKSDSFQPK